MTVGHNNYEMVCLCFFNFDDGHFIINRAPFYYDVTALYCSNYIILVFLLKNNYNLKSGGGFGPSYQRLTVGRLMLENAALRLG